MSMSVSNSNSTSVPTVTETPENSIIDQISGTASQLAGQMFNWAQGVFAQTSAITNQTIGNFFQVSQNMLGLSNTMTGQYNNLFAPENAQLVADANSYNSTARQQVDMGQAGATAAQAGAAGLASSEEALRSFGIDPSSGRYAALDKAAAVQNAANIAGAENTQRNADVQTGQNLRSQAVQVGAQLPAAIANVNNTGIQANVGAENSILGNANTGAALMSLPNNYLQTAMGVKLPLQGQTSKSTSTGTSTSPQQPGKGSGSGGGSGAGAGAGGAGAGGPAWMPAHGGAPSVGGGPQVQGGPKFTPVPQGGDYSFNNPTTGIDPNSFNGSDNIYQPQDGFNMGVGQAGTNPDIFGGDTGVGNNPFGDSGFGQTLPQDGQFGGPDQTFGGMSGGTNTEFGNISYDPSANQAGVPADWSDPNQGGVQTDWGSGADIYSQGMPSMPDTSGGGGSVDTSSPSSDFYAGDYSGGEDTGMAAGGPVPSSMSPSRGARVDDVRAQGPKGNINLNANEFVIPQDVALWKGQEFFQNLIDQSRKRRVTASAQPKPMGQQPQQQAMG